jgi:hypothetical protein
MVVISAETRCVNRCETSSNKELFYDQGKTMNEVSHAQSHTRKLTLMRIREISSQLFEELEIEGPGQVNWAYVETTWNEFIAAWKDEDTQTSEKEEMTKNPVYITI